MLNNRKFNSKASYVTIKLNKAQQRLNARINEKINACIDAGILPEDLDNMNELHKEIYNKAVNTKRTTTQIIHEYINGANVATKQKYIHRIMLMRKDNPKFTQKGKHTAIQPKDIIINEYCPFLEIKIDYSNPGGKKFRNNGKSIDRFNNECGYVSGNVWVISRLANVIKNAATIDELKTFCKNVIKIHGNKAN